jgi:hypothetical protein
MSDGHLKAEQKLGISTSILHLSSLFWAIPSWSHLIVTLDSKDDSTTGWTSCDKNGLLPLPSQTHSFLDMTRPCLTTPDLTNNQPDYNSDQDYLAINISHPLPQFFHYFNLKLIGVLQPKAHWCTPKTGWNPCSPSSDTQASMLINVLSLSSTITQLFIWHIGVMVRTWHVGTPNVGSLAKDSGYITYKSFDCEYPLLIPDLY